MEGPTTHHTHLSPHTRGTIVGRPDHINHFLVLPFLSSYWRYWQRLWASQRQLTSFRRGGWEWQRLTSLPICCSLPLASGTRAPIESDVGRNKVSRCLLDARHSATAPCPSSSTCSRGGCYSQLSSARARREAQRCLGHTTHRARLHPTADLLPIAWARRPYGGRDERGRGGEGEVFMTGSSHQIFIYFLLTR